MNRNKPPLYKGFFAQFPMGMSTIARVMEHGANKYEWYGWLTVEDADTLYRDALLRHLAAIADSENDDPESGLPHVAHVAANAMILLELYEISRDA